MGVVPRIVKACERYPGIGSIAPIDKFRGLGFKYPLGRYIRGKLDTALGVLPEEKRARLRRTVRQLFEEQISDSIGVYEEKRRARVAAALGRAQTKGGSL